MNRASMPAKEGMLTELRLGFFGPAFLSIFRGAGFALDTVFPSSLTLSTDIIYKQY